MAATPNRQDSSWGTTGRADFGYREWSENGGSGTNGASPGSGAGDIAQMAKVLGWFSLGLGLAQIAAPARVARLIGRPGDEDDRR